VPRSELAVAHKWPPCDSTMERLIGSPMPVPPGLVVKKCPKNLLRLLRGQSHTRIADRDQQMTVLGLLRLDGVSSRPAFTSFMASIPLSIRFMKTCCN
jgi:hypothetical protein